MEISMPTDVGMQILHHFRAVFEKFCIFFMQKPYLCFLNHTIMEQLYEFFNRKLKHTPTEFFRYQYNQIKWNGRAFGIVGPRGVGKSTMLILNSISIRQIHSMYLLTICILPNISLWNWRTVL